MAEFDDLLIGTVVKVSKASKWLNIQVLWNDGSVPYDYSFSLDRLSGYTLGDRVAKNPYEPLRKATLREVIEYERRKAHVREK